MAEEIGAFTTPDARRVWKATLATERGLGDRNQRSEILESETIQFRNDTNETIPAYACMQITGTEEHADRNIFVVKKPLLATNMLDDQFLFNTQYEVLAGKYGTAQTGCIFRAINSATISAGERIGPVPGAWTVGKGSFYTYLGDDAIKTNCIRIMVNDALLLASAISGIPARSGLTLGKNSVGIYRLAISGTDRTIDNTGMTITAYNLSSDPVASGAWVLLKRLSNIFVVIWEDCPV